MTEPSPQQIRAQPVYLDSYGGAAGTLAPFGLFLIGVGWLALSGAPDERGFWPILLAALTLGLGLAKDRQRYADAVIKAMSQPIVALMILAWMLAGVLGVLLSEAGLIQSLSWLARSSGFSGPAYIGAAFVACAVVSTATGTSFGTILIAGPLLYPAGGPLHADPAILMGAILAGSTFGDSISPVSDTTIASAGSQETDVAGTVRSRLKYVIPAGALALVTSVVVAAMRPRPGAIETPMVEGSGRAFALLLVPVLVVWLLARHRHLLEGLLTGVVAALALGVALGLLEPSRLLYIDRAAYGAKGLILDGMSRGVGVSVFTLLLMGLVGALQDSRLFHQLGHGGQVSLTARSAELRIVGVVSAAVLLTTHSVVAMLAVGPYVRRVGERAGLHAYRRANLLDMTVCTYPFLLPYFLPTILASGASGSATTFGMPRLSPWQVGMANTYAWWLVVAVIVAVLTGFGRTDGRGQTARSNS